MSASQAETEEVRDDSVDETPVDPRRRLELLEDCREMVISRLSSVIGEALGRVGDELTALALRDTRRETQQALLDAVTLVRSHSGDIQLRFRHVFADIFERRIHGESDGIGQGRPGGGGPLSLVDDSVIAENIALDRLVQRVRSKLDPDEVLGVRARMGVLVDRDLFDENRYPASPETVFEALRRALDQLNADVGVREALLQAFEPHVSASLNLVYANLNERLRSNRILPRIRQKAVLGKESSRGARKAGAADADNGVATHAAGAFGRLLQQAGDAADHAAGALDALPENEPFAEMFRQLADGSPPARRLAARLLADPSTFANVSTMVPDVEPQLLESLDVIQSGGGRSGAGGSQLLAELLDQSREKGSPLDQLTVEIVSLVFDHLYADSRLPDLIKQQLLRLQIVAVKAALIDRSFFARRQHPMRRLLDGICKAAIDPDADASADSGLVSGITEIVDWLIASFENDLSVFDDAVMRLDMLGSIEAQRRVEQQAELVRQAQRLEALTVAQEQARAEIALRTDPDTPAFLREFLDRWWAGVIAVARVDGSGENWASGLRCVEALVWSATPKVPEDIPRLASLLPKLIGELTRGLKDSGIDDAQRARFFDDLLQWHTHAIHEARSAAPSARPRSPDVRRPAVAQVRSAAPPPRAAQTRVREPVVSPEIARIMGELRQGDLLEMLEADGARKPLRLAWVSPSRTLFVLTRFPDVARPVPRAEVAGWLESGRLRVADVESTLDRAIGAIAAGRASLTG
jgi:hypothetical protein